jgi:hypothetical protein
MPNQVTILKHLYLQNIFGRGSRQGFESHSTISRSVMD